MANEKRLIDANEIIAVAEHAHEQWSLAMVGADDTRKVNEVFKKQYLCKVVKAVAENCLIVDAVEVVRCRDCFANGCCSVQIDLGMGGEGYCPKGRRISRREIESAAEIWNGYAGRERKDND